MNDITFDEVNIGDLQADTTVSHPELVDLEATPTTNEQTFTHQGEYGYDTVTVNAVDHTIDENITPANIKAGVSILGVNGTLTAGVNDVKVNGTSIVDDDVADIKTNGTYDATSNKIATMSDLSGFITTETDPVFGASVASGITSNDVENWNGKSNFSGSYNDLTNKPDLSNYLTSTDYATSSKGGVVKIDQNYGLRVSNGTLIGYGVNYTDYGTALNQLVIDKGTLENVITGKALVNSTDLATKQDKLVSGTSIKTINSESLLGSGDIVIPSGTTTDVQMDGVSITSSGVANIATEGTYNSSTNKVVCKSYVDGIVGNIETLLEAI